MCCLDIPVVGQEAGGACPRSAVCTISWARGEPAGQLVVQGSLSTLRATPASSLVPSPRSLQEEEARLGGTVGTRCNPAPMTGHWGLDFRGLGAGSEPP